MKHVAIVYDVSELCALVSRDLRMAVLQHGDHLTETTLESLLLKWFHIHLEEVGLLFSSPSDRHQRFGTDYHLHPAYMSLLYRIVDVPPYLKSHEIHHFMVEDGSLILIYQVSEREHARHSPDNRNWIESLPLRARVLSTSRRELPDPGTVHSDYSEGPRRVHEQPASLGKQTRARISLLK